MRILRTAAFILTGMVSSLGSAQAEDWTGFYGGLAYGHATGDIDFGKDGIEILDYAGSEKGAFVGYNVQMGNIVYGAELAYSASGLEEDGAPNQAFESFVDLKGTFGYAAGNGLYYGILGVSNNNYQRTGALDNSTGSGFLYGIGAQYSLNEQYFVGAEMLRREIDNDGIGAPVFYQSIGGTVQSVTVRVGMSF